jgi:hypothetical protein
MSQEKHACHVIGYHLIQEIMVLNAAGDVARDSLQGFRV